jgi:hypothetical protein
MAEHEHKWEEFATIARGPVRDRVGDDSYDPTEDKESEVVLVKFCPVCGQKEESPVESDVRLNVLQAAVYGVGSVPTEVVEGEEEVEEPEEEPK